MKPQRPKQKPDFSNSTFMQTMLEQIRQIRAAAVQPPTKTETNK